MVVVAVLVYDRISNIENWIRCWKLSDTEGARLVIIQNYRDAYHQKQVSDLCKSHGIDYISRKNVGFDIGAFQDVCRNRLPGFDYNFSHLLWCTDDILPVRPTFIKEFMNEMKPGVAAVCYEVSVEPHPHIRTTGFMLGREMLGKIRFNVDPIVTKVHCYDFEHRDPKKSLIDQVTVFGSVVQVADIENSPLWDSGLRSRAAQARHNRRKAEQRIFKSTK